MLLPAVATIFLLSCNIQCHQTAALDFLFVDDLRDLCLVMLGSGWLTAATLVTHHAVSGSGDAPRGNVLVKHAPISAFTPVSCHLPQPTPAKQCRGVKQTCSCRWLIKGCSDLDPHPRNTMPEQSALYIHTHASVNLSECFWVSDLHPRPFYPLRSIHAGCGWQFNRFLEWVCAHWQDIWLRLSTYIPFTQSFHCKTPSMWDNIIIFICWKLWEIVKIVKQLN